MGQVGNFCCEKDEFKGIFRPPPTAFLDSPRPQPSSVVSSLSSSRTLVPKKVTIDHFLVVGQLGEGGFGRVFLVKKKTKDKYYAMKRVAKSKFASQDMMEQAITEKEIMHRSTCKFITKLHYSSQHDRYLYYVMDWAEGGELFSHIRRYGRLTEPLAQFYAAESIVALKYLHENMKVIYRDLKPDNILLDREGHIKLTDFGLSKSQLKSYR